MHGLSPIADGSPPVSAGPDEQSGGEVIEACFNPILDAFLMTDDRAPLAVALSGGGDSVALLHLADAWARRHGRDLAVLTVDHGLQIASCDWAMACARLSQDLGRPHSILTWQGPKPASGLPAAARAARHGLLAEAVRSLGGRVLLLGHTADDLAEGQAMRAAGSTLPDPRTWSPSPAWPEGRGLFLLRPLLAVRRQALRDWLVRRDLSWIEDPANQDVRYARARARSAIAETGREVGRPGETAESIETWAGAAPPDLATAVERAAGLLVLPRTLSARALAAACLCASGGVRPPRREQLSGVMARLARPGPVTATLAGARLEAEGDRLWIMREAGEFRRLPIVPLALPQYGTTIWDGRFELAPTDRQATLRPLAGQARRLPPQQQARLRTLRPAARLALPVLQDSEGGWTCPILAAQPPVSLQSLVLARFWSAMGQIRREADMPGAGRHGKLAGDDLC